MWRQATLRPKAGEKLGKLSHEPLVDSAGDLYYANRLRPSDVCLAIASVERAMIYQPTPFPEDQWDESRSPFEQVDFTSGDGTRLHGLFVPHPNSRGVALFCHGNAGNVASRAWSLWVLNQRHQLSVMTFDYRGYGKSEGKPSELGVLADARAARAWLAQRTGVREQDILLMGRSLGGGVAVDLAANDGARGLVLASTFSSLPDVAAHHLPWTIPHILMTQRLNSRSKIKRYYGPLLQSHGDADRTIPIELAQRLFDAAPGPKRFVVIPGADHNDERDEGYRQVLDEFISSLPPLKYATSRPHAPDYLNFQRSPTRH